MCTTGEEEARARGTRPRGWAGSHFRFIRFSLRRLRRLCLFIFFRRFFMTLSIDSSSRGSMPSSSLIAAAASGKTISIVGRASAGAGCSGNGSRAKNQLDRGATIPAFCVVAAVSSFRLLQRRAWQTPEDPARGDMAEPNGSMLRNEATLPASVLAARAKRLIAAPLRQVAASSRRISSL